LTKVDQISVKALYHVIFAIVLTKIQVVFFIFATKKGNVMSIRMRIYDLEDKSVELKKKIASLHGLLKAFKDSPELSETLKPQFKNIEYSYLDVTNAVEDLNNLYQELLAEKSDDESLLEEAANFDEVGKNDLDFLKHFIDLISQNMNNEYAGADFYASKMALSRSTLFRRMKGLTGMNINEFIRKVKLDKSREFLRSGDYTVNQVASMVGINSVSYFRSLFKANFGISTGEYIRHHT
jgi:AraC-like DNA-binding protein